MIRELRIVIRQRATFGVTTQLSALQAAGLAILVLLLELHKWSFASARRWHAVSAASAVGQEAISVIAHETHRPW